MCSFIDSALARLLLLIFLTSFSNVMGQLYPLSNQYIYHGIIINPAESGKDGALSLTLGFRNQWVGFEGSPQTLSASAHAPVNSDKIGLGLLIHSDSYGIVNHTSIRGNYAYRVELGRGILALGLSAGIVRLDVSTSKLHADEVDEDFFNTLLQNNTTPNFGAGVYYQTNNYFIGLSIPQILSEDFEKISETNKIINKKTMHSFFCYGGYQIKTNTLIGFEPSLMMRYVSSGILHCDITPEIVIDDKIWVGGSYRTEGTMSALLRCKIDDQLSVGYFYDFEVGDRHKYLSNTHEIMLRYILKYKTKVVSPR